MAQPDSSVRRIKLNGARFDGGRLPIDSLVELERYQELLRIVARSSWRQDHPGEDLPAGFDDQVSLTIESIEPGSADVMLAFEQHAVYQEYQRAADDTVSEAIAASYESRELPALPAEIVAEVRENILLLGTSLEAGQSIEVYTASPSDPPTKIDIDTRHAVIQNFSLEDFVSEPLVAVQGKLVRQEETLVGRITEIDAEKATFRFESLRHGRLIGHYDADGQLFDDIRKVLDSPAEAPILRVEALLQYKRDGSPWRLKETYAVEQFVPGSGPWADRLIEFAQLASNWADSDEAAPVAVVALEATNTIMQAVSDAGHQLPSFYPTEEGGVILEWATLTKVRSVEVTSEADFELFERPSDGAASLVETANLQEAVEFAVGEGE